jgi:tetratricopeptide (TPR) repeat protein
MLHCYVNIKAISRSIAVAAMLILCISASAGQNSKLIRKQKKKADSFFDKKNYLGALNYYLKIYEQDSVNPELNYRIGTCMYNLKDKRLQALRYFEKCSAEQYPEALFYKASLYHLHSRFDEAIQSFNAYQNSGQNNDNDSTLVEMLIGKSKYAKELMQHPLNVAIRNVGKTINSSYPDYVPLISADGTIMIFTSRRSNSTGNLKDMNGEYMEDVYVSYRKGNGWTEPASISNNINTDMHDACVALSPDGQQLIIYRPSEDWMTGDLYLSRFNGKDWTIPELMGSDINVDDAVEASATFSPDNNMLIFSSDRSGGYGGRDLYRVVKLPGGEWSKAQNLGSTINTSYDEDAPFLHTDGKTLYFSSKSHLNMGGYDIFKSTLNEDGSFTLPENMGYPINTVNDDIYFILSVNGDKGYFSSKGDSTFGGTDIYSIDIPEQNFGLAIVNCIISAADNTPISANITLVDTGNNVAGKFNSSKETGKFIMVVSPNRKYTVNIQAAGYQPYAAELIFRPQDFTENVTHLNISLTRTNPQ